MEITTSLILLIVAWVAVVTAILPVVFLCKPERRRKRDSLNSDDVGSQPDVSVVVYCDRDSTGLINVVSAIKRQRYSGKIHIIVTVDVTSNSLGDTVKQVQYFNPDVYVTYVPDDTRNVSRRKLALYLGVKAARTDEIVFTDSSAVIRSEHWLSSVMRHFTPSTDIVVGPVAVGKVKGNSLSWSIRKTDFFMTTLTWLGAALNGRCYRGSAANLAYRKTVFFNNKGFAASLNKHMGDDDIFISEIATDRNVAVNTSPEGVVDIACDSAYQWEENARMRLFTSRGLGRKPRLTVSLLPLTAWVNLVVGVLAIIFAGADLFLLLLAIGSIVAYWLLITLSLPYAFKFLCVRFSRFAIYPSVLVRPIVTALRSMRMTREKEKNYTWKKLK